MTQSFTGNLLVASSLIEDPIFAGGVSLLVHQDDHHVVGVMLNRPLRPSSESLIAVLGGPTSSGQNRISGPAESSGTDAGTSEVAAGQAGTMDGEPGDLASTAAGANEAAGWRMLHFGGPLSGPVVAVHQLSQYAEVETGHGIYVAAQKQHLADLMRRRDPYRLIVGHLGWQTDQLQAEIDAGLWHLVPASVDTVFASASEMWPRLIRRATANSLARWIGVPDLVDASVWN
jgi:putative transcriptional regulator